MVNNSYGKQKHSNCIYLVKNKRRSAEPISPTHPIIKNLLVKDLNGFKIGMVSPLGKSFVKY